MWGAAAVPGLEEGQLAAGGPDDLQVWGSVNIVWEEV